MVFAVYIVAFCFWIVGKSIYMTWLIKSLLYLFLGSYFLCVLFVFQVQQNLFQSHTSASSRLSNDKGSTNELPIPLHYGAAGQGHELPPSSIKAHLLVDDSFSSSSNSQTLSPRFYELRPVLPGDSLDKEVLDFT